MTAACTAKHDASAAQDTAAAASATGAPSATDAAAVRRFIDSAQARFIAASDRGDLATILADYTNDAMIIRPDLPLARGPDAVRKAYGAVRTKDTKVHTEDVLVSGDLAVETGTYEMTLLPNGAAERKETGKYVMVWQRQADGSWKGVRDVGFPDTGR